MRKTTVIGAVALSAVVLATSSCGLFSGPNPPAGTDSVFTIVRQDEPPNLDPKDSLLTAQTFVGKNVTESLVMIDPETGETAPLLAKSWEWDGANEWTVHLRDDVTFHDGSRFDADAVVANIERMIDPDEQSTVAGYISGLSKIEAIDDFTVRMVTAEPDPIFLRRTFVVNFVAPDFGGGDDDAFLAENLIGTGPYELAEWDRGQSMDFVANEDYWGEAPPIKNIHVLFRGESSVRASMIQAGEAQVATNLSPADAASVASTVQQTTADVITIRVDTKGPAEKAVLKELRFREALLYALDMDTITKTILAGIAIPALGAQVIPPNSVGYNDALAAWPYDPEKAKDLVQDLVADGFDPTIPIDFNYKVAAFPSQEELVEVLIDSWAAVGITGVFQSPAEGQAWVDGVFHIAPGEDHFDMMLGASSTEVFDMGEITRYLLCDGFASLACDETFDVMLKEAALLDGPERQAAYEAAAEYAQQVIQLIGLAPRLELHGTAEGVQWTPRPGSDIYFSDIVYNP